MKVDDRFGDPEQTRLGPRYCWVVSDISMQKPEPAVKGIPADKALTTYLLSYRTNPDTTYLKFAEGLGIAYYEYEHHGTPGNCAMQLVETGIE